MNRLIVGLHASVFVYGTAVRIAPRPGSPAEVAAKEAAVSTARETASKLW